MLPSTLSCFFLPIEIIEAEDGFTIINKQRKISWGVGYKLKGGKNHELIKEERVEK